MGEPNGVIWLASYPRSGNTWVRLFLSSLLFNRPLQGPEDFHPVVLADDANHHIWQVSCARPLSEMNADRLMYIRLAAIANQLNLSIYNQIVMKTHTGAYNWKDIPLIPSGLTTGAIHLVRDPRAVLVSWAKYMGRSQEETFELMCNTNMCTRSDDLPLRNYLGSWHNFNQSWDKITVPRLTIRYEDLLGENNFKEFKDIARFVFSSHTDEQIAEAIKNTQFGILSKFEKDADGKMMYAIQKEGNFFRSGKVDEWKEELDPQLIKKATEEWEEDLEKWGYELTP